jgi:hypothetical protein
MKKTGVGDLALPLLVIGALVYLLLHRYYGSMPQLSYFVPVPLFVLAVGELVAARRVRAVVRHDPDAKPIPAIVVARLVALGKASSLVGAGAVGASIALLARVVPDAGTVSAAAHDTRVGLLLLAGSIVLVVAGLLLERSGVDPGSRDGATPPAARAG